MNLLPKTVVTLGVLLVAWTWLDTGWLFWLTVGVSGLSIWWITARRLIWLLCAALVFVLIVFFLWRPGGASHYTNYILTILLTLTLLGSIIELALPPRRSDVS